MKKIIPFLLLMLIAGTVLARQNPSKAIQALKQLMHSYTKNTALSFELRFTYAPESKPLMLLDSLQGKMVISGNRNWYMIDSTESVNTGDFLVTVFREDKLLVIAKPASASLPQATGLSGLNEAWFSSLDSLVKEKKVQLEYREDTHEQQIDIRFPGMKQYKAMSYVIDRKTGLLKKSVTLARADQLQDPDSIKELNMKDEYSIITTWFGNYNRERVSESIFDPSRYFTKKGDEYSGAGEFRDYKVFLGTPNM